MTNELVLAASAPESREGEHLALTPAQAFLRKMVLDSFRRPTADATTPELWMTSSDSAPADLSPGSS